MDEALPAVERRMLRKRLRWSDIARAIRITSEHRPHAGFVMMMEVRPSRASAAAGWEQVAAGATIHMVGIGITLPEHPELRAVDNVDEVALQQIEFRLVVVEIHAGAYEQPPIGRDGMNTERRAPAWTAASVLELRHGRDRGLAEIDRHAELHQPREPGVV